MDWCKVASAPPASVDFSAPKLLFFLLSSRLKSQKTDVVFPFEIDVQNYTVDLNGHFVLHLPLWADEFSEKHQLVQDLKIRDTVAAASCNT